MPERKQFANPRAVPEWIKAKWDVPLGRLESSGYMTTNRITEVQMVGGDPLLTVPFYSTELHFRVSLTKNGSKYFVVVSANGYHDLREATEADMSAFREALSRMEKTKSLFQEEPATGVDPVMGSAKTGVQ